MKSATPATELRLTLADGTIVSLSSVIQALESSPSGDELAEAVAAIRADRVKEALSATVQAAQFDRDAACAEFLDDGKSGATRNAYARACLRFFAWLDRQGIHVLLVDRATVNRYKRELATTYAPNSVRLHLAACSSFYAWLEADQVLESSPFARISYPKRQYRKAVRPDRERPEPVMSSDELSTIEAALAARTTPADGHISQVQKARAVARLARAVHVMSRYGLRVSSLPTLEVHREYIAYRIKGGEMRQKEILTGTREICTTRYPLEGVGVSTIQNGLRRLTVELHEQGAIRYAYSAHDFRHAYAVRVYEETRDVYRVMRALDHANVQTTVTYLAGIGLEM